MAIRKLLCLFKHIRFPHLIPPSWEFLAAGISGKVSSTFLRVELVHSISRWIRTRLLCYYVWLIVKTSDKLTHTLLQVILSDWKRPKRTNDRICTLPSSSPKTSTKSHHPQAPKVLLRLSLNEYEHSRCTFSKQEFNLKVLLTQSAQCIHIRGPHVTKEPLPLAAQLLFRRDFLLLGALSQMRDN